MQPNDLKHTERRIRKMRDDAASARKQSALERDRAEQFRQQGNEGNLQFHSREADKLDDKADQLESEIPQLESQQSALQQKLTDLQQQRETLIREHTSQLDALERDIERARGDLFSL